MAITIDSENKAEIRLFILVRPTQYEEFEPYIRLYMYDDAKQAEDESDSWYTYGYSTMLMKRYYDLKTEEIKWAAVPSLSHNYSAIIERMGKLPIKMMTEVDTYGYRIQDTN